MNQVLMKSIKCYLIVKHITEITKMVCLQLECTFWYSIAINQVCGVVLNVICSIHNCLKEGIAFTGSCA